ncbi:MAG: response regulator [Deltaproteobacteria bacterium]|nr:response regulator [Deltaproteobacteria bacterium]
MTRKEKTVLIVDDEMFIRQSFTDYFEDLLWRPLAAESGEQALKILETVSPHGAIVDIRLGGMDGDAFIREAIRKKPKTAFVICTGFPEYDVPADLLELPCVSDQVFRKPVTDMKKLEKEILRLIGDIEKKRG